MSHPLRRLGRSALVGLAEALAADRIAVPFTAVALAPHVPDEHRQVVVKALNELHGEGMTAGHVARVVGLLAEERAAAQRMSDRVQLVWSPPELDEVDARDTVVVVGSLFREAESTVLVASYAIDEGQKAQALFGELAARMDADERLSVRLMANVHRKHGDETPAPKLVRAFADRFRTKVWPGDRLPEVFYDPRAVELEGATRAVLHAKCVVADGRWTLLTSANFTEAAQERNIEAGVLVDDRRLAARVTRQFDALIAGGALRRLRLP